MDIPYLRHSVKIPRVSSDPVSRKNTQQYTTSGTNPLIGLIVYISKVFGNLSVVINIPGVCHLEINEG